MIQHPSGLHLLPAPLFPDQAEQVSPADIEAILKVLSKGYEYVIVDTPPFFEERALVALEMADQVMFVGSMDLPTIKNMQVTFSTMEMMSYPKEKVQNIMNRADSKVGIDSDMAEKHLGVGIDFSIPSSIEVTRALNAGEIIVVKSPSGKVGRELSKIVSSFNGGATDDMKGRRFFRRA